MYVNADYILAYVMLGNYSTSGSVWEHSLKSTSRNSVKALSKNVVQKMKENTCTQSRNWKIVSISTLIVMR